MNHSSSLIGDPSLVESTSGVSRRSSSSAGVADDVDPSSILRRADSSVRTQRFSGLRDHGCSSPTLGCPTEINHFKSYEDSRYCFKFLAPVSSILLHLHFFFSISCPALKKKKCWHPALLHFQIGTTCTSSFTIVSISFFHSTCCPPSPIPLKSHFQSARCC